MFKNINMRNALYEKNFSMGNLKPTVQTAEFDMISYPSPSQDNGQQSKHAEMRSLLRYMSLGLFLKFISVCVS